MTVESILDIAFSVTTAVIAGIALFQTKKQIQLSNRQQLFDRRLNKYLFVKELLSLYSQHRSLIVNKPDIYQMVDYQFSWLTNCSALESMNLAMISPLSQGEQKVFLQKCETLEKSAIEITLLWESNASKLISQFVEQYKELLEAMYHQQILLNKLHAENIERPMLGDTFKKRAKEGAELVKLITVIEVIDTTYNKIVDTKAEEKLIESIKL